MLAVPLAVITILAFGFVLIQPTLGDNGRSAANGVASEKTDKTPFKNLDDNQDKLNRIDETGNAQPGTPAATGQPQANQPEAASNQAGTPQKQSKTISLPVINTRVTLPGL